MNPFEDRVGRNLKRALMVAAWLLAALLAVGVVYLIFSLAHFGEGVAATNTISVSGTGDAYAIPDTAEFSFSVSADAATVAAAQASATQKANALTQYLLSAGVDKNDIQTTDYEINPTYKNEATACPMLAPANGSVGVYCPPSGNEVLTGYEVTQTTEVKVASTTMAGTLLSGVGQKGATNVSGLSFTAADPSSVQEEARSAAIADAQSKAKALAHELGVSIVRVTNFEENTGGYPMPVAFSTAASGAAAPAPDISPGQNKVTDNVTITYEIQ
ncbi:MAG: SIMPL domain-containing protein [Minisyncoccia bacterium]